MTTERFDSTERPAQTAVFATTHWSVVLTAGDTAIPGAPEALEKLCRTYWYPLYAYVRRQRRGAEEAQDLTQAFFAQLLARGSLGTVSREKGRFRSFLLAAMNHFLADEWDRAHRQKRGGDAKVIPLDALEGEERYRFEPVDRLDAARLFDRRWAMTILEWIAQESMQDRQRIGLPHQLRVEVEIELQPAVRLHVVYSPRHQQISRV